MYSAQMVVVTTMPLQVAVHALLVLRAYIHSTRPAAGIRAYGWEEDQTVAHIHSAADQMAAYIHQHSVVGQMEARSSVPMKRRCNSPWPTWLSRGR